MKIVTELRAQPALTIRKILLSKEEIAVLAGLFADMGMARPKTIRAMSLEGEQPWGRIFMEVGEE